MKVNVKGTYFTSRALKNHSLTYKPEVDRALMLPPSVLHQVLQVFKATIGNKIVETLYSNRITSENKTIRTPPLPPPFKVGVFVVFCRYLEYWHNIA